MMATALNMVLWSRAYTSQNSSKYITGAELYAGSSLGRVHFSLNKPLTSTSEKKLIIYISKP